MRGLGITAGQGYLLGRPGKEPVADPLDLDSLITPEDVPLLTLALTSAQLARLPLAAEG